ncbi:MAG: NAD(P)-dependent oxidoreductase [Sulfuritalea sp.]|nr:NAD(P)-dependent oxidoreductase [Sulfuritalea sp.]
MRIIVTGASGFIGQKLCCALLERGHEIVALCRTGILVNADHIRSYRHIPYVIGDLLPLEVEKFSPEALVHLAWDGIPDFSQDKCIDNLESQIRFFKQTEKFTRLKKIVGAGTCREYGFKQGACIESDCIKPDSYFAWAKQALSEFLSIFCQQKQILLVWFRIFYIYGPGQRNESLIPSLIRANNSKQFPDIRNPVAANDYVYIDDVVSAFVKGIEDPDCHGTFNLGSGNLTTVAKIAKIVELMMQNDEQFLDQSSLKMDECETNAGMCADITLASHQLNWSPQISLFEGIRRSIRASL